MEQPDTAVLVASARAGDPRAWDDLVERFLPLVCATIARQGLFGAEADDVNQTVWLRLVEHLDQLREPRALPGWIVTITRNECLRTFERGRRTVPVDPHTSQQLEATPDDRALDDDLLAAERQQVLREGLAELSPERRELLLLLVTDPPVPYREVSRRLGIPIGSIGPTRARALEQLRNTDALASFLASTPRKRGDEHDVVR